LDERTNARADQRRPGWRQQVVQPSNSIEKIDANDPALLSYPRGINPSLFKKIQIGDETRYVKIVNVNEATGETVYSVTDFPGLKNVPV